MNQFNLQPKVKECIKGISDMHKITHINIVVRGNGVNPLSTSGIIKVSNLDLMPRLIKDAYVDKYNVEIIGDVIESSILNLFISYRHILDMTPEGAVDVPSINDMRYDFHVKLHDIGETAILITESVFVIIREIVTLVSIMNCYFNIRPSSRLLFAYIKTAFRGIETKSELFNALRILGYIDVITEEVKENFNLIDHITASYNVESVNISPYVLKMIDTCLYHMDKDHINVIKNIVKYLIDSNDDFTELLTVIYCMITSFDRYYGNDIHDELTNICNMIESEYESICDADNWSMNDMKG